MTQRMRYRLTDSAALLAEQVLADSRLDEVSRNGETIQNEHHSENESGDDEGMNQKPTDSAFHDSDSTFSRSCE